MDYEWAMLWLTRLLVGVKLYTHCSLEYVWALISSQQPSVSDMHAYLVDVSAHGSCRLQGGGIGAVALAVLYTFQERLVHLFARLPPSWCEAGYI